MIGTIANASTILVGSIIGSTLRKGFDEKYKNIMMDSMGLAATALGINSIVQAMPDSKYHVLFIVSLALGGIIGTALSLDTLFDRAVSKISKGSNLAQGLSTAILLYCAGTLSILGPIQSALQGDNTYLFTMRFWTVSRPLCSLPHSGSALRWRPSSCSAGRVPSTCWRALLLRSSPIR